MTVRDLIEKLYRLDRDLEVVTRSSNFEHNGSLISLDSVGELRKARKKKINFVDSFDGTEYYMDVWVLSEDGKNVLVL